MWAALAALWAALGVVLGRPWRLLGLSWASRGAPRRLAGELREVILERILKVDPGSRENHNVLTFLVALVASTFAAVFGRLLPSLWRARRRRVP